MQHHHELQQWVEAMARLCQPDHIVWIDGRLARSAPFHWTEFGFRTMAGIYFAVLFAIRGFGITAGTHAFYDIIATFINAIFFEP